MGRTIRILASLLDPSSLLPVRQPLLVVVTAGVLLAWHELAPFILLGPFVFLEDLVFFKGDLDDPNNLLTTWKEKRRKRMDKQADMPFCPRILVWPGPPGLSVFNGRKWPYCEGPSTK